MNTGNCVDCHQPRSDLGVAGDGDPAGQTLMPGLHLSACGFALAAGIVGVLIGRDWR